MNYGKVGDDRVLSVLQSVEAPEAHQQGPQLPVFARNEVIPLAQDQNSTRLCQ